MPSGHGPGQWLYVALTEQGAWTRRPPEVFRPSTILWLCDTHNLQQQALAIAMRQCTGVRKSSSSHTPFFTTHPDGLPRAFHELVVTFSLPNPTSLLCHRTLPQTLKKCHLTHVFPNVPFPAQPACFPRSVGPEQVELPPLLPAVPALSTSQRGSCSCGLRAWLSWLCWVCAN